MVAPWGCPYVSSSFGRAEVKRPLCFASLSLLVTSGCAEEPRVGVVDVEQAFQRSPLMMVSALMLKGELASVQRDIKKRGRELAELRGRVEHGDLALDAEQRAQIGAQIEEETLRLTELQRRYRADLALAQERQGQEMIARIEEVARDVARREGLAILVRMDDLLYAEEGVDLGRIDITEQVARALLEKINPAEIPEPAPGAAP